MAYFGISAKNEEQKLALRALDNDKPITILTEIGRASCRERV